ncbi:MAG TPA: flavodoxin family protein [Clostridia bacterium]
MNITAYNGSPRKNGNTQLIIEKILESPSRKGINTGVVNLNELNFKGCQACYYCKSHNNQCILKDDMQEVHKSVLSSDVLIFGSPVYMWQITAQFKLFLDRLYNFYNLNAPSCVKDKKLILVFTQGQLDANMFMPYFEHFKKSLTFMGFDIIETLIVPGVRAPGEAGNNEELIKKACEIGERLANNQYA